ncbi:hypothetical protein WOLCODRAFT_19825 [Wolfiporia cocos MD-104 SS10]|uniref:NCS1 nucleoside transporter family n=1 Tax=Wolfiporia cocos (strain MD-104) TaxID=742152 RepID=A0A2H3J5Z6_WOLCO|nr:hypothetical protein WOLCODRAFT_19825 [Wolfiporia cocos MD-104 SS10]
MPEAVRSLLTRVLHVVQVDHDEDLTYTQSFLTNDDLRPVPVEKRTWKAIDYCNLLVHSSLWISNGFTINTYDISRYNIVTLTFVNRWMVTSSMIQLGLSWWQAFICVWVAYLAISPFIVLNSRPGAVFHITFPVVARASFGIWGSLWCVLNRAAMACIWYGVQASWGGDCVLVMLRAMWPSELIELSANSMPASSGTNTRDFMCFFLFSLISLPAIWPPMHKIRYFFTFKAIITPIAGVVFMVWCIVKAHGVGPIVHQPGTVHGSQLGWAMVSSIMSCFNTMVTLVTPSDVVIPQLVALPLSFCIVSFLGIIVSSSSQAIYGRAIWSPIDLMGMFLDDSPSHATRFGIWFIAAAFIIATIGTNVSANSISAGCDLTALLPRYINIRRGGYIAAIVGFCMCPWNLLSTSSKFTTYLSAYAVFLSSFAGVMAADYWLVHKGHYRVSDLYSTDKDGWYRAYGSYIAGFLVNVVGFAGATGRTVPLAATHIYELSFFTGYGVSALVYWILNLIFPARGASRTFEEVDLSVEAEEFASVGTESEEKEKESAGSNATPTKSKLKIYYSTPVLARYHGPNAYDMGSSE